MKPALVILAAGIGSRYGSLKQVDPVGPSGETIMDYSLYDALHSGFGRCVFVIQKRMERDFREVIQAKLGDRVETGFAFQEMKSDLPESFSVPPERTKPWGTSHAVLAAASLIQEPFAVINADDFYGRDSFRAMAGFLSGVGTNEFRYAVVGYNLEATLSEHGAVARGVCEVDENGMLEGIVERTHVERTKFGVVFQDGSGHHIPIPPGKTVSMNFWGFTPTYFASARSAFRKFLGEKGADPKAEFFIPLVVNQMINEKTAVCRVLPTSARWFGVTYKEDRPRVIEELARLVEAGEYPKSLWG
ncbi:MAG: nucleotidyltransferase [Candidatus Aminicenantes bacterium]|nr:nucleotidyltransferase [Candidatus Aminicenantes bacterium]